MKDDLEKTMNIQLSALLRSVITAHIRHVTKTTKPLAITGIDIVPDKCNDMVVQVKYMERP